MTINLDDYNEVPERIREFRARYPDGSLQAEIIPSPFEGFLAMKGYAFRTGDDPRPGVGHAWEPVPGKTPYTKDSELQNCETSAWGRAIVAALAADAKKIATKEDVVKAKAAGYQAAPYQAAPAVGTKVKDNPLPEGPFATPEQQSAIVDYFSAADQDLDARLKSLGLSSVQNLTAETAAKWIEHFKKLEAEKPVESLSGQGAP